MLDKKAYIFEVPKLSGKHGRICGRYKHEGRCALPGEICMAATSYRRSRDDGMGIQKSAEGIVDPRVRPGIEGPNILAVAGYVLRFILIMVKQKMDAIVSCREWR